MINHRTRLIQPNKAHSSIRPFVHVNCFRQIYFIFFTLCLFLSIFSNSLAQSPAMYYADSLMATPAGVTMYNNFMANPQTEDTTANGSTNYAYQATMNYYMTEYLQAHPQHFDSVAICYNADFSLNIPADNFLYGYRMYDGVRNSVTDFNYVTALNILPDNKIPTDAYIL